MKKILLVLLLSGLLLSMGSGSIRAQDVPKPKKDTVNMDTDAKPKFYYAVEDEKAGKAATKGSGATIAIVCGGVVVAAGVGFFLLKKKKR
jgi:uncharacterized protein YceK